MPYIFWDKMFGVSNLIMFLDSSVVLYPYFCSLLVIVHMQDFALNILWNGGYSRSVQYNCTGLHKAR